METATKLTTAQILAPLCDNCPADCSHPKLGQIYITQEHAHRALVLYISPALNKSGELYARVGYIKADGFGDNHLLIHTHENVEWTTWKPAEFRTVKMAVSK